VVVGVGAGVVADRAVPALHAADDPELLEQLERRVDGRQRDARQQRRHGVARLLGRDVTVALPQDAVDHQPRRGHAQPPRAQGRNDLSVGVRGVGLFVRGDLHLPTV
jgi:hypothetical protein